MKIRAVSILMFIAVFLPCIALARPSAIVLDIEDNGLPVCHWSRELIYLYAAYERYYSSGRNSILADTPLLSVPNDPYYDSYGSWGQSYADMWGLKKINIEDAWNLSTGKGVTVAILDTGIDVHSEIASQLWSNAGEFGGSPGVDDDGNGYVDDFFGWDFYYGDSTPSDEHGHGTHVSGIVGAKGNNNEGIIGVAYEAKVMAVKVFSDEGGYNVTELANGIRYAVDMGAMVLNCSFAVPYNSVILSAFQYAFEKGCIIVAAAGNDYGTISEYPAKSDYAITVGAIKENNARSAFSNYGNQLDVVAPGEDILSLRAAGTNASGSSSYLVPQGDPDAEYLRMSGTSMAAPFVSGLIALMISQDSSVTFDDIIRRLKFSCYDLGSLSWDKYYGWGRIDAFEALSHDWYDSGAIKTWWLMEPDEYNVNRYDYYESGKTKSEWHDSPDLDIIYTFDWDYQNGSYVKRDVSYDYDGDGEADLIYSQVYKNGFRYDTHHADDWYIISETNV